MYLHLHRKAILLANILVFFATFGFTQSKPNILMLTCEDMSPYLGCYGNTLTNTPNLDNLAAKGLRYSNAYSNGVQCSPARSTLISGVYAPMLGTDFHRESRIVPDSFFYPLYLKQAGYYCTNNSKQDYNAKNTPRNLWHENSGKATYIKRSDRNKPFFAVFNYGGTHMTRVATLNTDNRTPRKITPQQVTVPPYISDIPAVRDDIAWHLDAVSEMDKWVGEKLAELKQSGEEENTIILFYSDHGGCIPRGKAYVYETGAKVPLLIYFPPKWQHLAPVQQPAVVDRLVSFVDLTPSLLSLTGAKNPSFMVGKPFLGSNASQKKNQRKDVFIFRANQGDVFIPSRAITDGRYKLIRNFRTAYPNGSRQSYQWQMPAQMAWDEAFITGKTDSIESVFWKPMPAFEFYDLHKDPSEINNLALNDPNASKLIATWNKKLLKEMVKMKDVGLFPQLLRKPTDEHCLYHAVRSKNKPSFKQIIKTADLASRAKPDNMDDLITLVQHQDPVIRFWAAAGITTIARPKPETRIDVASPRLNLTPKQKMLLLAIIQNETEAPEVRCQLAEAFIFGDTYTNEAFDVLFQFARQNVGPAYASLQNLGAKCAPKAHELKAMLQSAKSNKWFLRSILINIGALPYVELYADGKESE